MKFIQFHFWSVPKWGFWIRFFGYGFVISAMHPVFSERMGYTKVYRVFGIKFKFLGKQF